MPSTRSIVIQGTTTVIIAVAASVLSKWIFSLEFGQLLPVAGAISLLLLIALFLYNYLGWSLAGIISFVLKRIFGYTASDLNQFRRMGFSTTADSLRESRYTPNNCIDATDQRLYFMGMLGSKWLDSPEDKDRLQRFLREMDASDGEVKFLLANPESDGYGKLSELRNTDRQTLSEQAHHYVDYADLAEEYESFQVRLYSNIPTFRLVFIDEHLLVVSRYRYQQREGVDTNKAWESIPHLELNDESDWPFYNPFFYLFEEIWDDAEPIQRI